MPSATRDSKLQDAFCPHCHLLIEHQVDADWPQEPLRCPHCRLLVGVGRARPTPEAEPGARGSAAGVFAHEAKRSGGGSRVSPARIKNAIRTVAKAASTRGERRVLVEFVED